MSYGQGQKGTPTRRRCHRCHGSGRAPCRICAGKGEVMLGTDGQGRPRFGPCTGCMGLKHTRCSQCGGEGYVAT